MKKKIVIVGLGLIGGSIAKALKITTDSMIYGLDTDEDTLLDACSAGAVDARATPLDLETADIIYLCIYPEAAVSFMEENKSRFKPGCIVTDTCGVKREICSAMEQISGDFVFVAGHPMAGKEQSGFAASDPSIFYGASYIIAPCGAPQDAVDEIAALARKMGFGQIVLTTPERHDRMIAFTSQVPHVLACAYVMSPQCAEHKGFSAGSYRDVSRVADINDALWSRLFLDNKDDLTAELDILIENIKKIKQAVSDENEDALRGLLKTAGDIKRRDKK